MKIKVFTVNPFQENTYILYDETKEAVIVDPGGSNAQENNEMVQFIEKEELKLTRLIHTHCHIDHMLGNDFICNKYGLKPELHKKELNVLTSTPQFGAIWNLDVTPSPEPENFIKEGDVIRFGDTALDVLFVPGHSPGHVVFLNRASKELIAGDVLFLGSIGRTDLPYANHDLLIESIHEELLVLDDDICVYPGHGPTTTIGFERKNNPFLQSN